MMNSKDRAVGDFTRGLAALAALLGLLAGVPAALLGLAGWPLPRSLPQGSAIDLVVSRGRRHR